MTHAAGVMGLAVLASTSFCVIEACTPASGRPPTEPPAVERAEWFIDVTEQVVWQDAPPVFSGDGIGIADLDGLGALDVLLTSAEGGVRVLGGSIGASIRLQEMTSATGLRGTRARGVAIADLDQDGYPDPVLFVAGQQFDPPARNRAVRVGVTAGRR